MVKIVRYPKNKDNKKTVIVLGSPRGGTSAIALMLRCLGVYMGEQLGHQHEDPVFKRSSPDEEKVQTILERNKLYNLWGWKMPDTVHYINTVLPYLINPYFIAIYRNPLAIAESSAKYDDREFSMRLLDVPINHYKKMHNFISNDDNPLLVCSLQEVQGQPEELARVVADFLKINLSKEQIQLVNDLILPNGGYRKLK